MGAPGFTADQSVYRGGRYAAPGITAAAAPGIVAALACGLFCDCDAGQCCEVTAGGLNCACKSCSSPSAITRPAEFLFR